MSLHLESVRATKQAVCSGLVKHKGNTLSTFFMSDGGVDLFDLHGSPFRIVLC